MIWVWCGGVVRDKVIAMGRERRVVGGEVWEEGRGKRCRKRRGQQRWARPGQSIQYDKKVKKK